MADDRTLDARLNDAPETTDSDCAGTAWESAAVVVHGTCAEIGAYADTY